MEAEQIVPRQDEEGAGTGANDGVPAVSPPDVQAQLRFSVFDAEDPRLQIINEDKNYSPLVLDYLKKHWKMADRGFDYNVVAVFGSQSTGKSTLLNRLFGTNFDVMNQETGRQQTTKGIWVSKADEANILVLDVEGTDGGERFEDQDFERKSALFSLAVSEVVIVNIYENNVGLYNGANLGLLKTVLDVNLQLFQQAASPKTCLFFVIRDFTDQTPISKLSATLLGYLNKIWAGLNKPAGKESCTMDDFFEFAFVGLPHKIFARDAFESHASKLRTRFIDAKSPDYVFKPHYHKHIPADGFPHFGHSIWSRIVSNRDLDLPTQTQLLAEHRCAEISEECYVTIFSPALVSLRKSVEEGQGHTAFECGDNAAAAAGISGGSGGYRTFGAHADVVTGATLAEYEAGASRYHRDVFLKKREALFLRMCGALEGIYAVLLGNLVRKAVVAFSAGLQARLRPSAVSTATIAAASSPSIDGTISLLSPDTTDVEFAVALHASAATAEAWFIDAATDAQLKGSSWSYEAALAQLREEMERLGAERRAEAVSSMTKQLEKSAAASLTEHVQSAMNEAGGAPGMWKTLVESYKQVWSGIECQLERRARGFEMPVEELGVLIKGMRWRTWTLFQESIRKEVSEDATLARLRQKFESKFRYDEMGVPRLWKLDDPIDVFFKAAFGEAEKLLVLFARMDVPTGLIGEEITDDPRFEPTSMTILPASRLQFLRDNFKKDANNLFIEAKRSMVVTTAKIPFWFVTLTIMLGWNEMMLVLFNPVYFVLMALFMSGVYAMWYFGMIGPAYQVAKVTLTEAVRQAQQQLDERNINLPLADYLGVAEAASSKQNSQQQKQSTSSSLSPKKMTTQKRLGESDMEGESIELKETAAIPAVASAAVTTANTRKSYSSTE